MIEHLEFQATGIAPLLQHGAHYLADPLSKISKEISHFTSKRTKTDDDQLIIRKLEFIGGLYTSEPIQFIRDGYELVVVNSPAVIMPAANIWRMLYDAAKRFKMGPRVKEGLFIHDDAQLEPHITADKVLANLTQYMFVKQVKLQGSTVIRSRPIFRKWSFKTRVEFMSESINRDKVVDIIRLSERFVGCGDWRPICGTFESRIL